MTGRGGRRADSDPTCARVRHPRELTVRKGQAKEATTRDNEKPGLVSDGGLIRAVIIEDDTHEPNTGG